jgi:hypothetical protein
MQYKIGISGKKKSGKNTLGSLIIGNLKLKNSEYLIKGIADPIKKIAEHMFPEINKEHLYGISELRENIISDKFLDYNNNILTVRQILKDIGKLGRSYNDDLWINLLIYDYLHASDRKCYIVSDIRMKNEFQKLKENKFFMIRIKRNSYIIDNDISEMQQEEILDNEFDFVIENNGSIEDLNNKIKQIISKINSL